MSTAESDILYDNQPSRHNVKKNRTSELKIETLFYRNLKFWMNECVYAR